MFCSRSRSSKKFLFLFCSCSRKSKKFLFVFCSRSRTRTCSRTSSGTNRYYIGLFRTVSTETGNFEVEIKVFRSNNSHFVQQPRSFLLSIFITSCTFHFDPRLSTLDLTQTESLVPQLWSRRLKVNEPKGKNWSVMRAESGRPKTWTKRLEVDGPKGSKWTI